MSNKIEEKKTELAHSHRKLERKIQEMSFCNAEGFSIKERLKETAQLQKEIAQLEEDIFFHIEQRKYTLSQRIYSNLVLLRYRFF